MKQITNVSYVIMKSDDPKLIKVAARFAYKNLNREYYIFIKKNPKYTKGDYLKEAKNRFEISVKKGKVADYYMKKTPFVILGVALGAAAIALASVFTYRYLNRPYRNTIAFDSGEGATLELYNEGKTEFSFVPGTTWDSFYKDHHYFGAVKNGYDFLYWSLDGKEPIPNNYVLDKSTHIVPVFHENTDGVSFIVRYIPNGTTLDPSELPYISYTVSNPDPTQGDVKFRSNYGEWADYENDADIKFTKIGDTISFKTNKSFNYNSFISSDDVIFAVSGDIKNLTDGNYVNNMFSETFRWCFVYSAGGLIISGSDLPDSCFENCFYELPTIVIPPQLPAKSVGGYYCYGHMFNGCSNLLVAPDLPATTLGIGCYYGMFAECASLIKAPSILPATTLESYCYYDMFYNCAELVEMPILPATITTPNCYNSMFYGCKSLSVVHDLPATQCYEVDEYDKRTGEITDTLASYCYGSMFQSCVSLQQSPHICAENIIDGTGHFAQCSLMFANDILLHSIKIDYKGNFNDAFDSWCNNVSASGTLYYNGNDRTIGESAIPNGWTVKKF